MVHNTVLPLVGRQVSVPRRNGATSGGTRVTDSLARMSGVTCLFDSRKIGSGQYAVDTMGLAGGSPAPGAGSAPG